MNEQRAQGLELARNWWRSRAQPVDADTRDIVEALIRLADDLVRDERERLNREIREQNSAWNAKKRDNR